MPQMVSLAERYEGVDVTEDNEYFPSIYLSDDVVEKLGLDTAEVGEDMTLVAKVRVSNKSENESAKGGRHVSVTLDLREAVVTDQEVSASDLYPNMEG